MLIRKIRLAVCACAAVGLTAYEMRAPTAGREVMELNIDKKKFNKESFFFADVIRSLFSFVRNSIRDDEKKNG